MAAWTTKNGVFMFWCSWHEWALPLGFYWLPNMYMLQVLCFGITIWLPNREQPSETLNRIVTIIDPKYDESITEQPSSSGVPEPLSDQNVR